MHPFPGNRRAAVSLTYDDCLPCHRTLVASELSARGLKGTFYCPAACDDLHDHVEAWRAVAAAGHELGNHTCFHPCRRRDGAAWPDATYDLKTYSRRRIVDEMLLAERVLRLVDGRERRSFAATCGNTTVGPDGAEESFLDDLRRFATVVRSGEAGVLPLRRPDLVVGSVTADGSTAARIIAAIEPVLATGGWVVVLAHGVGAGTHGLFVDADVHARVIAWIAERSPTVWSGTVSEVAACLQALPG
jgi:peptidoglycan/xylan/chitin deacetylase (PgdA/CDA1 family)